MNENAVFIKTEAGEDAVSKRTIVQRNLRSVLIMIDGRTPVGNLAQQFGDPLIVEGLVGELEHRGLVRRVDNASNEEDADRSELSSIMVDIEDLVSQPITPVADDIRRAHDRSSAKESPVLDEFAMAIPELNAPAAAVAVASPPPADSDDVRGAIRRAMMTSSADAGVEHSAPGPLRRVFDLFAGRVSGADRKGPPSSLAKRLVVGSFVLSALVIGTFFLYPYSRHLPQMEQLASELLGQPVRIASVSPSIFPEPSIALEGLRVGEGGQLDVATVKLIPRVSTLLSERTVMREVRIERAGLNIAFLPELSKRQDINWASRWLKVERISVVDSSLLLLDGSIGNLNGTLDINEDGALTRLSLASTDGGLKLQGSIESGVWNVALTALGWRTPGQPSLLLDVLEATGTLNSQRLQFDKVDVKLYGGYAVGNLSVGLVSPATVEGEMTTSRLAIADLLKVFAPTLLLTGDLSAAIAIRGDGETLEALRRTLRASGKLGVQRGQIERVDLVQAVRIPRPDGVRGGSTRFDRLEGDVLADASGLSLTGATMSSGLVGAQGDIRLADGLINGRLDVSLRGSATTVLAPVSIEGKYADPVVRLRR
ncbi:AsmA-like C-terminal region-containing protein [Methyloversatilis sp.]|uniref:AsmA-like C-terminal region-containing protein n=1 Tax=Methyloversatilis sp. TaxID=2569862 RepID=UPI00273686DF|nr:AsmA-like C-terminal region-containing protein [Methyloversatilis sp.]MDP3454544.1 AsmA-like C-terminal region-containing protein [Methyloversatilis sp.]MDP3579159.1 AsmA-like C-terminal region-containing protein [Methyloversatilis sp.]